MKLNSAVIVCSVRLVYLVHLVFSIQYIQYIFVIYHEVNGHVNTDHEHHDGDGGAHGDGDDEGRPENFGESMNV